MQAQHPSSSPHLNDPFLSTLSTAGLLQPHEISQLSHQAKEAKSSTIAFLIQQQKLSSKIIATALAKYLKLEFFDLTQFNPTIAATELIDETFIRQHRVLPLFIKDQEMYLAISEPTYLDCMGEVKFHTDLSVRPVVVEWDKLTRLINSTLSESQYRLASQFSLAENDDRIISWVEKMLHDAIQKSASDIHIEPYKTAYRIRFRLDGILHKITQLPLDIGQRVVARLKIMSRLDMAERRLPQDGRFSVDLPSQENKDCRISVCPTLFGEKIVVRILDAGKVSLDIDDLGLEKNQKKIFLQTIKKPQGMILVTGPTGSGKTVTLYTALNFLNNLEKNICTVEDPVEITLPGINQIHVDLKIQLTFSKVLRSFLRQDPDILMVGEIRDQETAETAIKAAQTGHLVLSTLHTNSAVETLSRLAMLGVSAFNIAHTVQLIIAQRLVRKLCPYCKRLKSDVMQGYERVGCDECTQGYKGRVAVFECLFLSPDICALVVQGKSAQEISEAAKSAGMLGLHEAALNKVSAGVTTLEEIQRVVYA
jgi:type IV pilus assembly protein PilB